MIIVTGSGHTRRLEKITPCNQMIGSVAAGLKNDAGWLGVSQKRNAHPFLVMKGKPKGIPCHFGKWADFNILRNTNTHVNCIVLVALLFLP